MGFNEELHRAFGAFGDADQAEACVASLWVLIALAEDVDVSLAKLCVAQVVEVSDAFAQFLGRRFVHQVSTMQLNPKRGVLDRQEDGAVSVFIDVAVVNDVLNGFDQYRHRSLGFLSRTSDLGKGSLGELNQVRNHVAVHRPGKGQNDTKGRPSLRLRHGRGMQPLLEQRNEGDGTFARHLFAIVDEWPIMSYERNDASYGNVALLPR